MTKALLSLGQIEAIKYKKMNRSIARSEKDNFCDYEILTEHEVRCLFEHCNRNLGLQSATVLLSLFLGRRIDELLSPECNFIRFQHSTLIKFGFFEVRRNYPSNHLNEKHTSEQEQHESIVGLIAVPAELADFFESVKRKSILPNALELFIQETKQFLREVNELFDTRLTLGRIARYFRFFCNSNGISEIRYGLIAGKSIEHHSGAYYTGVTSQQIHDVQMKYATYLADLSGHSVYTLPVPQKNEMWGSLRHPKLEDVAEYLRSLKNRCNIERLRFEELCRCSNFYTAYTLAILQLSTGHRPEMRAFGTLNYFDLENGYVHISDKKVGTNHNRLVCLCDTARIQLQYFIRHLQSLKELTEYLDYQISNDIEAILAGKKTLLCFINGNKFNFRRPLEAPNEVKSIATGLVNNFYRHVLRTYLDKHDVPTDLIDNFMGHEAKHDHSASKFSAITHSDAYELSAQVQKMLNELGVTPLKSPIRSLR